MAARMTGGEVVVGCLRHENVNVVFGVPGLQLYGILAALRREPAIRLIGTRHEQATAYMADGYARAGGRTGVGLVVPGPGLLNTLAGLSTAYAASSPVLMLAGQVPSPSIGKKVGVLHELDDQLGAVTSVTKWRGSVRDVREIPEVLGEAFHRVRSDRPRPVVVEIPPDVLEGEDDVEFPAIAGWVPPAADSQSLDEAARLLLSAGRVAIIAGGGVHASGAHAVLAAVAEHLQAGVVETPEGRGAVSTAADLWLGAVFWSESPQRAYVDAADVVLAAGTRLAQAGLRPEQQLIHVDIDSEQIGLVHRRTLALVGDARATLERLLERLRSVSAPAASRRAERDEVRRRFHQVAMQAGPAVQILSALRANAPDDTIVFADMTQIGYYSRAFWPVYQPRTYFTSSYSGNLGFAFPAALGAKIARPHQPVISLSGDGGFQFNIQELATAAQHRINVVAVVFNDHAYGNVARDLEAWGGEIGTDLQNPDFMKVADAYGVIGLRAKDPMEAGGLLKAALEYHAPVLLEVPVGTLPRPPYFPVPQPHPRFGGQAAR
jgi:acetolactate synthase-1/2/3 large subunit